MVVVALSPHPDDVEIGCFGSLTRLSSQAPIHILTLTSGEQGGDSTQREKEALESAALIRADVRFLRIQDGALTQSSGIVSRVLDAIREWSPESLYVPYFLDTHQDHRACSEIGLVAGRNVANVYMYETPSTREFLPTVFWDITSTFATKWRAVSLHVSQAGRTYMSRDWLETVARFRGLQAGRSTQLAEGFVSVRQLMK